jgi:molecular chaperone GrpE
MSQSDNTDTEISVEDAVKKGVEEESAEHVAVAEQSEEQDLSSETDTEAEAESETEAEAEAEAEADAEIIEDQAEEEPQPSDEEPVSIESLTAQLEAAKEEIASHKDNFIRAQAEMQNVRKRLQRDVENAHKYGLEKFLTNLLPLIDSLEKAVESARQAEEANEAIAEGVELCLKMLLDILGKENIEQIFPEGEPFDPQYHEAMSVIENPDVEPNSVVTVFQKGYMLNGRLVRPALVIVSKAGESKKESG